jgi:hypothetical protein
MRGPSILAVLLIIGSLTGNADETMSRDQVKATLFSIERAVVDLTNPLEPLHHKEFVSFRKSMSVSTAKTIVRLIQAGELNVTQSHIGIHALSGLPEETYWAMTSEMLSSKTKEEILSNVLLQPLPYGPSYANAYKNDDYRRVLLKLSEDIGVGKAIKAQLELILKGKAAKIYKDFRKHPERYGY